MGSQLAQNGDVGAVGALAGLTVPLAVASGTPSSTGTYYNQYTVRESDGHVFMNQTGTNWTDLGAAPSQATRYLALLTADPILNGAVSISDSGFVECITSGYARQSVTFGNLTTTYPSNLSNTNLITFTMSSTMLTAVQWVALVTVSSGTTGWFLASWALTAPILVDASQSIQFGIGNFVIQGN